jgi:hypothetical protein
MATYDKGILGSVSGKIGTVVGGTWKGIDYLRSKGRRKRNAVPTEKQKVHRAKFSFVAKFIQSMSGLPEMTFKHYTKEMTASNFLFSYTMDKVLKGAYPDFSLDYQLAIVAKGSLPNGINPAAVKNGIGQVQFNWSDNSGNGIAKPDDKAILVVYCEDLNQCQYKIPGADRQAGTDTLNVSAFSGKLVQTWLSFISADGDDTATSIFTGAVNVD